MNKDLKDYDEEFDFQEIISVLWSRKLLITFFTSIAAILSVLYALSLPNIYTSKALLATTSSEDSLTSKLGNYSSFAGLAGISLPSGASSKASEAIERIQSYDFFVEHFLPFIKLEDLLAAKKWHQVKNQIEYDDKLFDIENNEWVRLVKYPMLSKPSEQEAFIVYQEILSVSQDNLTSFVSIQIDHISPYTAQNWLRIVIDNINHLMGNLDKESAINSIAFLQQTAAKNNLTEIKTAVSSLIESQMKILTLTETKDDYVFKTISSPIAPEHKTRPSRAKICILGTIMGLMIGIFTSLLVNYFVVNLKK